MDSLTNHQGRNSFWPRELMEEGGSNFSQLSSKGKWIDTRTGRSKTNSTIMGDSPNFVLYSGLAAYYLI